MIFIYPMVNTRGGEVVKEELLVEAVLKSICMVYVKIFFLQTQVS